MRRRAVHAAALIAFVAVASGCDTAKSSNPTSPSVAGPIAGVSITVPKLLEPVASSEIPNNAQPITLLIENSSTNGQRAVTYVVEVGTDSEFSTKVFSREGVAPGDGGRTTLRLPDALEADRTYYWRARATDGANASPYSAAMSFVVYVPANLGIPTPLSPVGDARISGLRPVFVVRNSARSGPIGAVSYIFEISENDSFSAIAAVVTVPEAANETRLTLGQDLRYDTRYFWRVRSFDSQTATTWCPTQVFLTPSQPVVTATIGVKRSFSARSN
jgi:phosphodiesterase/alkaline phosphatase D-like protein